MGLSALWDAQDQTLESEEQGSTSDYLLWIEDGQTWIGTGFIATMDSLSAGSRIDSGPLQARDQTCVDAAKGAGSSA
ncbi:hypothetical protein Tco_1208118 [Tanacetum coccineum]